MGIESDWVIGLFDGSQAKRVKEHADAGIGYFILGDGGAGANYQVKAAFLRPRTSPIPQHLQKADITQSLKLEKMRKDRSGINSAYNTRSN